MKYIESLREGERINEIYLCKVKQSALTKAGKPYDTLILQDKTGTLDAKIWEPGSVGIDEFDSLDYIAVMGDITSFQGNLQLNVKLFHLFYVTVCFFAVALIHTVWVVSKIRYRTEHQNNHASDHKDRN